VKDAIADWPALSRWSWASLSEMFGEREVDVYDDWFVPTGAARLAAVLDDVGGSRQRRATPAYVRWSNRMRPGDGRWADDVFEALSSDWRQPDFLPTSSYVVPARDAIDASTAPFPYRSLLFSSEGGRTRLHVDPWASSGVLCQVIGRKRVLLYDRAHGADLLEAALAGAEATAIPPTFDDVLGPGDVIYVPGGWWHDVTTLEPSITVTWNFVHRNAAQGFADHVRAHPDDPELSVAEYFVQPADCSSRATLEGVVESLRAG
jgi:hypothetical protein